MGEGNFCNRNKHCYNHCVVFVKAYKQLQQYVCEKFSETHRCSKGITIEFKLPKGEKVYYTFHEDAAVKVRLQIPTFLLHLFH